MKRIAIFKWSDPSEARRLDNPGEIFMVPGMVHMDEARPAGTNELQQFPGPVPSQMSLMRQGLNTV